MHADEFVAVVRAAAPDDTSLKLAGLEPAEIAQVLEMFACPRRATASASRWPASELLQLLASYDCSSLEIGVFRFVSPARSRESDYLVGYLEADAVILNEAGSVLCLDHSLGSAATGVMCAVSGEAFLDALAYRLRAGVGAKGRGVETIAACARLAGVDPESSFWRTIAG